MEVTRRKPQAASRKPRAACTGSAPAPGAEFCISGHTLSSVLHQQLVQKSVPSRAALARGRRYPSGSSSASSPPGASLWLCVPTERTQTAQRALGWQVGLAAQQRRSKARLRGVRARASAGRRRERLRPPERRTLCSGMGPRVGPCRSSRRASWR
eukprot:4291765-Prymnesium_polylepis.1